MHLFPCKADLAGALRVQTTAQQVCTLPDTLDECLRWFYLCSMRSAVSPDVAFLVNVVVEPAEFHSSVKTGDVINVAGTWREGSHGATANIYADSGAITVLPPGSEWIHMNEAPIFSITGRLHKKITSPRSSLVVSVDRKNMEPLMFELPKANLNPLLAWKLLKAGDVVDIEATIVDFAYRSDGTGILAALEPCSGTVVRPIWGYPRFSSTGQDTSSRESSANKNTSTLDFDDEDAELRKRFKLEQQKRTPRGETPDDTQDAPFRVLCGLSSRLRIFDNVPPVSAYSSPGPSGGGPTSRERSPEDSGAHVPSSPVAPMRKRQQSIAFTDSDDPEDQKGRRVVARLL